MLKKACSSLGKGWRLPTKDEILFLQENIFDSNHSYFPQYSKYNFEGLSKGFYDLNFFWSFTEKGDGAWGIHFIAVEVDFLIKSDTNNVRPVRSLIN
jgi:hypothetical protein